MVETSCFIVVALKLVFAFAPLAICILYILKGMRRQPDQKFYGWLRESSHPKERKAFVFSDVARATSGKSADVLTAMIQSDIQTALLSGKEVEFNCNQDTVVPLAISGDPDNITNSAMSDVAFQNLRDITLSNVSIRDLVVYSYGSKQTSIYENCYIGKLKFVSKHTEPGAEFIIRNCWIGTAIFHPATIRNLEISGGGILNVECPNPQSASPFQGPVVFKDVYLARNTKPGGIQSAQPMRNLRAHLMVLGNVQAASPVHSAELALDRETEQSWCNKIFSWLYEISSDFGASTTRPLVLILGFTASTFLLALFFNAATPQLGANEYQGWQQFLVADHSTYGNVLRALTLATQPITNPLGIFGSKALMVANTGTMELWMASQGIVLPVLIALLIFALRRRFKLN